MLKVRCWIIALCGVWEFADIAALFVPGFGRVPAFLWSHIIAGLVLLVAGTWAALTGDPGTARRLSWLAVAAGLWLILGALFLGDSASAVGQWNDILAGALASILGLWSALARSRSAG